MQESASPSLELVIFDCDGVLIDSERIFNRILASHLNGLGAGVDLEYMFEHFIGHSWEHCLGKIAQLLGGPAPDGLREKVFTELKEALPRELTAIPGVSAALEGIRHPVCVASNSAPEEIRANLALVGLLPRFGDKLFSAKQVARPKPAPDVYLFAASAMGRDPRSCLVIEDSPAGVTAATAAGMIVAGYAAHTPGRRLREAGARHLFADMGELPGLIASFA
jgi:HAD superfamily hydrolase (TIGR01509 family)